MKTVEYYGMGQWPIFVGFTTSRKAFKREMKRLSVSPCPEFLVNDRSNAATHFFTHEGQTTCIITMNKPEANRPVEQVAGMIAHEAVHVAQELWENVGEREPGKEAEAYLVQMITQCCLQDALETGRSRKEAP